MIKSCPCVSPCFPSREQGRFAWLRPEPIYTKPMRLRFRIVLTWLLLLALPLQGFAAATMVNCGPNHHVMMAAAMADTADSAASEHDGAGGQHHHEMGAAADHHEAASNDADAPSVHHLDKLMKFKCSACAACCMGAAMPTAAVGFEPLPPVIAPAIYVPTSHVGFVSDGPDKPPRLSFV